MNLKASLFITEETSAVICSTCAVAFPSILHVAILCSVFFVITYLIYNAYLFISIFLFFTFQIFSFEKWTEIAYIQKRILFRMRALGPILHI